MKTTGHVQFKPSSVMASQLEIIAEKWDVPVNQLVKNIIALSLNNISVEFYMYIYNMARANNNLNTFEECASHIGSFLKGRFSDADCVDYNDVNTAIIEESNRYVKARK